MLIGYVDNHGTAHRADRRPGPGRGRLAHRPRPPQRRRAHSSRCTGSRTVTRSTSPRGRLERPRTGGAVRRLRTWTSSGTPRRRRPCSTRSCPTSTRSWRHLVGARVARTAGAPTATCMLLRQLPARAAAGLRGLRPRTTPQGVVDGLNALLEQHPITPRIADHDPDRPAHPRRQPRPPASPTCSSASRCSAWPRWSATSARPGSGSAPRRRAPTSTSTPRPTSRAATAPTAAPRGPTSRRTAPGRRPPRAEGGHRIPRSAGNSALRGEISAISASSPAQRGIRQPATPTRGRRGARTTRVSVSRRTSSHVVVRVAHGDRRAVAPRPRLRPGSSRARGPSRAARAPSATRRAGPGGSRWSWSGRRRRGSSRRSRSAYGREPRALAEHQRRLAAPS